MNDIEELGLLKNDTLAAILEGATFMTQHGMDVKKAKVRSTSPMLEKYGIWPTTELLEFLLTNDSLPITPEIVNMIENMVGFIIDKFDHGEKQWPLTDAEGSIFSAITSGHCIYVLKLYISRPFVDHSKIEAIKQIIKLAEKTLIADCRADGSWRILEGDDGSDPELNYGRFFYTYNAWFGIKKVNGYSDDLSALPNVKRRLIEYVIGVSDVLFRDYTDNKWKNNESISSMLVINMARAIQILNDSDDINCCENKKNMRHAILHIVNENDLNNILKSSTTVDITELPYSGYTKFSNNVPFDLFFAIYNEPDCAELACDIIKWYIAKIDSKLHCWFFPADLKTMNTWPTCEALLVLSTAHKFFFETAIKQYYNAQLVTVKEKHKQCEKCKEKVNGYLKPEKERFKKSMDDYVREVKKNNIGLIAITVFLCVCAVAALIALSVIWEKYWLNSLITVVIIPLIIQIICMIKMPKYSDEMHVREEILSQIEESKEIFENE